MAHRRNYRTKHGADAYKIFKTNNLKINGTGNKAGFTKLDIADRKEFLTGLPFRNQGALHEERLPIERRPGFNYRRNIIDVGQFDPYELDKLTKTVFTGNPAHYTEKAPFGQNMRHFEHALADRIKYGNRAYSDLQDFMDQPDQQPNPYMNSTNRIDSVFPSYGLEADSFHHLSLRAAVPQQEVAGVDEAGVARAVEIGVRQAQVQQ
jgi:hypothetical protein